MVRWVGGWVGGLTCEVNHANPVVIGIRDVEEVGGWVIGEPLGTVEQGFSPVPILKTWPSSSSSSSSYYSLDRAGGGVYHQDAVVAVWVGGWVIWR